MISKYEMGAILNYLDSAFVASAILDAPLKACAPTYEGHVTWCIRMAREKLLRHAISEVEVEPA